MNQKTYKFGFGKFSILAFLLLAFAASAFSQDDDIVTGKVIDAGSRRQIGKAEIITASNDFGFYIKMWLDGGKLRIIRPLSGSRSSTINCSFQEYKYDTKNPKDDSLWMETVSGNVSLQVQNSGDEVRKMSGSKVATKKVVGDNEVVVNEKPQRFEIIIE